MANLTGRLADKRKRIGQLAVGDTAVDSAFHLSYRLLTDREKLMFLRLGLHPVADFSVAAAAALADLPHDEVATILDALADVSLLEPDRAGDRYRMHDLLRLYARHLAWHGEPAGPADPAARQAIDRLSAWYIAAAQAAARLIMPEFRVLPLPANVPSGFPAAASPGLGTAGQAAAWLETERAAIVALAVQSAVQGSLPPAWLLADALRGYFFSTSDTEDWLVTARAGLAAARRAGDATATAAMLINLGQARASRCQYRLAISHYRQAAARAAGWPAGRATALGKLGTVCYLIGELDQARHYYQLSLEVRRQMGDRHGEAVRLGNLAGVHRAACAFPEAARLYAEALALHRKLGNRHGEALTACNYAHACRDLGRPAEAVTLSDSALVIARQLRSRLAEAVAQYTRAAACLDLGRHDEALAAARQAVSCSQGLDDEAIGINSLNALGHVELAGQNPVGAAACHADALAKARRTGFRLGEIEALLGLARTVLAGGKTGEAREYARQAERLAVASHYRIGERQARAFLGTV